MPRIIQLTFFSLGGLLLAMNPVSADAQLCNRYGAGSAYVAPAYPANPGYTAPYIGSYGYDIYSAPRYGAYGYDYNRWHDREEYERRAWREYRERERREQEWREHERRERRSREGWGW
jgi:hypothetical protein